MYQTTTNPVALLRQAGVKVQVRHYRVYERPILGGWTQELLPMSCQLPSGETPLPTGGMTQVGLTLPNGSVTFAQAVCSDKDQYNRKQGVKICLGRLHKKYQQYVD